MPQGHKVTFKEKIRFLTEIKSDLVLLKSGFKITDYDVFVCPLCKRIIKRKWKIIKDKKRCNCTNYSCDNRTKREYYKTSVSIEKVRKDFTDRGFTPLFTEYKSCVDILEYLCICGKKSHIRYSRFKLKNRTCLCKECSIEVFPRGKRHPSYNKNLSEEHRKNTQRRSSEIGKWYLRIFKIFNYSCCISNQRGGNLSAHHLYSYADYPERRLDIENGVCMSREFHEEFHKKYGRGKNTPQQFSEFYMDKTGKDITYKGGII